MALNVDGCNALYDLAAYGVTSAVAIELVASIPLAAVITGGR